MKRALNMKKKHFSAFLKGLPEIVSDPRVGLQDTSI